MECSVRNPVRQAGRPPSCRCVPSFRSPHDLPNTRDKLRGARSSTLVLQKSDPVATRAYHASLRLQPPLVSFIALFGSVMNVRLAWCRVWLVLSLSDLPYEMREVMQRLLHQDDNAATYSDEPAQNERANYPNRPPLRVTFGMKQDVPA